MFRYINIKTWQHLHRVGLPLLARDHGTQAEDRHCTVLDARNVGEVPTLTKPSPAKGTDSNQMFKTTFTAVA